MRREQFRQFIASVFNAEERELLCSEFFDRLPRYVDLELAGEDSGVMLPDVKHHLGQCPECHEVYVALLEALRDEAAPGYPGNLPRASAS